ncbi:MAG: T9SS type A sorting domain-containing protein, partial [bacterium]
DFTTPANSTFTLEDQLTVNAFTSFPWSSGLTQKGSSVKLAALGDRLMARLQFRVFSDHWSMVTNHSVNVGAGISGVRWYEMRKSVSSDPWSIYQQGTYNPDNNNRWMGSIAMDSDGNMALGYSIASANLYPSIRYTGRMNGDLPGEMTIAEAGIMNGGGAQTNNWQLPGRWGDYSSMTVDPAQPSTFWYTQEYYSSTASYTWKTRIASFSFANIFNVILSADPDSLCLKDLGSTQLNSEPSGGSGSYTYSWTSNPTGFISSEKSPVTSPEVTTYYLCTVDDGTQTKTDSVLVTVIAPPNVFAGNDTSYCWYIPAFPLNGVIDFYDHVKWETSGDGHFNIDTVANTLYFTGQGDKDLGHVTLTLYAYLEGMCPDTTSDAITVILDPCTGIPQPSAENLGISIQPNPARNLFTLTIGGIKSNSTLITITDMQGRTVLSEKVVGAGTTIMRTIDVSEYRKGAYLVKVQTDKEISTERLIIQ